MQQTPNYKLNKPEMGDTFSPDPLNENADKLEAELARVDETAAALDQRVVHLENCRVIVGIYKGNYNPRVIDLGGRPAAVIVCGGGSLANPRMALVVGNEEAPRGSGSNKIILRIVDNGFEVEDILCSPLYYNFLAVMGDWADFTPQD